MKIIRSNALILIGALMVISNSALRLLFPGHVSYLALIGTIVFFLALISRIIYFEDMVTRGARNRQNLQREFQELKQKVEFYETRENLARGIDKDVE